jgi:hypothetical protein
MAKEQDDSGSERSDEPAGEGLDPEIGPSASPVQMKDRISGAVLLRDLDVEAVHEQLMEVSNGILVNQKPGPLASTKLIFGLATRLKSDEEVSEEEYRSLAEVLWKDFEERETLEANVGEAGIEPGLPAGAEQEASAGKCD